MIDIIYFIYESYHSIKMPENNGINLPANFCNQGIGDCLYSFTHNDTLLAASISLLAASITIAVILIQISQSERHRRDGIIRQHMAAKCTLNIALLTITDYLKDLIWQMSALLISDSKELSLNKRVEARTPFREFPHEVMHTINKLIETSPNKKVSEAFAKLSSNLQLVISRTDSITPYDIGRDTILIEENITFPLAHCVFTCALVEAFFKYGRGANDIQFPIKNDAETILFRLSLFDHQIPGLLEQLQGYLD